MKASLCILLISLLCYNGSSQFDYSFELTSVDYPIPPAEATDLLSIDYTIGQEFFIESSFPINFSGRQYDSFLLDGSGLIVLSDEDEEYTFSGYLCDISEIGSIFDRQSNLYHWKGEELGDSCHYFQWVNVGHWDEVIPFSSIQTHSINFTIKVYASGKFSFQYGDIDLENAILFTEGGGFKISEDDEFFYGCFFYLQDPLDINNFIGVWGTPDDLRVSNDFNSFDNFPFILPKGSQFSFIPNGSTSTVTELSPNPLIFYPNPFKNEISYESDLDLSQSKLIILDALNRPIINTKLDSNGVINLQNIIPNRGTYFFICLDNNDNIISVNKMIKE